MATRRLFNRCLVRSGIMLGVSRHERPMQPLLDPHPPSNVGLQMCPWGLLSPCGGRGQEAARLRNAAYRTPLAQIIFRISGGNLNRERGQQLRRLNAMCPETTGHESRKRRIAIIESGTLNSGLVLRHCTHLCGIFRRCHRSVAQTLLATTRRLDPP